MLIYAMVYMQLFPKIFNEQKNIFNEHTFMFINHQDTHYRSYIILKKPGRKNMRSHMPTPYTLII